MDVKIAFLHGEIDQLIYVEMPRGYEEPNMVCKLIKSLYGLKQSPRLWYERLAGFLLKELGLSRLHADHSIFATEDGVHGPILTVFVDDIKILDSCKGRITRIKQQLATAFRMVDMGPVSYYLGLKVERDRSNKTIKLSQPTCIEKVLRSYHLEAAKTCPTPMKEGVNLLPNDGQASEKEKTEYQGMIGAIMFSMVEKRPDIAFAISVASRSAKNPSKAHIEAAEAILRYLSGSRHLGIVYGGGDQVITGYSDSDWAGDK